MQNKYDEDMTLVVHLNEPYRSSYVMTSDDTLLHGSFVPMNLKRPKPIMEKFSWCLKEKAHELSNICIQNS